MKQGLLTHLRQFSSAVQERSVSPAERLSARTHFLSPHRQADADLKFDFSVSATSKEATHNSRTDSPRPAHRHRLSFPPPRFDYNPPFPRFLSQKVCKKINRTLRRKCDFDGPYSYLNSTFLHSRCAKTYFLSLINFVAHQSRDFDLKSFIS